MQRRDALNNASGASNTGQAKNIETVFIENQNNYMPDEKFFARKLWVRLGHVHGPHDQDQQGQHKDVSRRIRNGPSRQCR